MINIFSIYQNAVKWLLGVKANIIKHEFKREVESH